MGSLTALIHLLDWGIQKKNRGNWYPYLFLSNYIRGDLTMQPLTKNSFNLSNVTNHQQLSRENNNFNTFNHKLTPSLQDVILLEKHNTGNKHYCKLTNLPPSLADSNQLNNNLGIALRKQFMKNLR